jgi:PelA/Pel-15E family pectate lyase
MIQYQSPQGGWPKNTELTQAPRTPEDIPPPGSSRANSIDNEATTLPMHFLAHMITATGEAKYRSSFDRGLDYVFSAQYPNGGWPQFYPLREGYYSRITYNDDAMIRVLTLLRESASGKSPFAFVGQVHRQRAATAVRQGIDCILRTQIKQDGKLTGWCAQHDEKTLEPAWARSYEPPSLSGSETVGIVRFLMEIENPSPEVIGAVERSVAWLKSVAIHGKRLESFKNAEGKADLRIVEAEGETIWARFYDLGSNRPIFLDRDSSLHHTIDELSHERRNGYAYHGTWPTKLLALDYPRWQATLAGTPSSRSK